MKEKTRAFFFRKEILIPIDSNGKKIFFIISFSLKKKVKKKFRSLDYPH